MKVLGLQPECAVFRDMWRSLIWADFALGQTSDPSLAWKKGDVFKINDDDKTCACLKGEKGEFNNSSKSLVFSLTHQACDSMSSSGEISTSSSSSVRIETKQRPGFDEKSTWVKRRLLWMQLRFLSLDFSTFPLQEKKTSSYQCFTNSIHHLSH